MSNQPSTSTALAPAGASAYQLLTDPGLMHSLDTVATLMAEGKVSVPEHLRKNKGDCFAIALQSMQWQMNPFAVAQKTFMVSGKLGYEAQLVAAAVNNSGLLADRFKFEWFGPWENILGKFREITSSKKTNEDTGEPKKFIVPAWNLNDEKGLGVKVWATLRGESTPRSLELLLVQARVRNSTMWADDPKQQLAYLAQKKWSRLYAPDVILGVYTPDELQQSGEIHMGPVEEVGTEAQPAKPAKDTPKTYPAEKFEKNVVTWAKLIAKGARTMDEVVATAESVGVLTDEQKAKLTTEVEEWKKEWAKVADVVVKEPKTDAGSPVDGKAEEVPGKVEEPAQPEDAAPLTLDQLTADMREAADLDTLYVLADRIDELPEEERDIANNVFSQRQQALGG